MDGYDVLTSSGTSTRDAAALAGVPRAKAVRRQTRTGPAAPRTAEPANRLTCVGKATVLAVLTRRPALAKC